MAPEVTLERISRHLTRLGISRCADVTGLDELGVPVYVVVRPVGRALQTSVGKGVRALDAKVSGLMESIEMHYWENPIAPFEFASHDELTARGQLAVDPRRLPEFRPEVYYAPDYRIPWLKGDNLLIPGQTGWVPAASAYTFEPSNFASSTNGLASGNTVAEATIHAMYELYERHSLSVLVDDQQVSFDQCDVIALDTIAHPVLTENLRLIRGAGVDVRLFRVQLDSTIHTFCAVLLDTNPFAKASRVNIGTGSHLNPVIAASRALTEAAQSRLTFIHASREDLRGAAYLRTHDTLHDFVSSYTPAVNWASLRDFSGPSLAADSQLLVEQFRQEDCDGLWRTVLSEPELDLAVVKVVALGSQNTFPL